MSPAMNPEYLNEINGQSHSLMNWITKCPKFIFFFLISIFISKNQTMVHKSLLPRVTDTLPFLSQTYAPGQRLFGAEGPGDWEAVYQGALSLPDQ